jgi:hypothetical protein
MYSSDESSSTIDNDNVCFPYLEKMLEFLRLWSTYLDMDSTSRIENLNNEQIAHLLMMLSETEYHIGLLYTRKSRFDDLRIIVNELFLMLNCMRGKKQGRLIYYVQYWEDT